jgi:hypothetical protein
MKNEISLLTLGLSVALGPLASAELLTENDVEDTNPRISGDLIVWESRVAPIEVVPEEEPDTSEGELETVEEELEADEEEPEADEEEPEANDFEIMVSKGGVARQITDNEGDDINAAISKSNVVWQSWDGTDWEIWVYNFKCDCLRQVTDNAIDDINPQIDGNQIVWQAGEGDAAEIGTDQVGLETVEVVAKITPSSLNLSSRGRWVSASLSVTGDETTADDVDLSTIFLEGDIPALSASVSNGTIRMKFSRSALSAKLAGIEGDAELTISAETSGATEIISGVATIKVLPPRGRRSR